MIPWPLAALSVLYGLLAFLSAVRLVECIAQQSSAGIVWTVLWLVIASGACIGLPAQKEWGRRFAVVGAALFTVAAIIGAVVLVVRVPPHPQQALLETVLAGVALIIIRYLRRPVIKAQFQASQQASPEGGMHRWITHW